MDLSSPDTYFTIALLVTAFFALISYPLGKMIFVGKKFPALLEWLAGDSSTVKKLAATELFTVPEARMAMQIIESWFPHNETDLVKGAPVAVWGWVRKSLNYSAGTGEIRMQLYYRASSHNKNGISVTVKTSSAMLLIHVKEKKIFRGTGTELAYDWVGPIHAFTDKSSSDYKVLDYMIKRVAKEYESRGFHLVKDENEPVPTHASRGQEPKMWWREYSATTDGGRIYVKWPNPQEYSEAVQSPMSNIGDAELQGCRAEQDALGMPRVASGMFASVYEMTNGENRWAFRCFTSRLKDQQERYKAISAFIMSDDLPYTLDFHYFENGIKCGADWYPAIKMNWIAGVGIDRYIDQNIYNPELLEGLRLKFQIMMERLRINGIAHGDLQHGNVLISDDEIYLVDYDGFFVPQLAGKHSNELGHGNYQHPGRTEADFGPYLDNFSAQLIDITLLCLVEDSSLWKTFNGGDECLLFRRADFKNPESSKLIAVLRSHGSEKIREAVEKFLSYLALSPSEVPYLTRTENCGVGIINVAEEKKVVSS